MQIYEELKARGLIAQVTDEEQIRELVNNGKATFYIFGEEFKGKWSLDGEKLTVKQSSDTYTGTLKNGTATIDFGGMVYTFQLKGGASTSSGAVVNAVNAAIDFYTANAK